MYNERDPRLNIGPTEEQSDIQAVNEKRTKRVLYSGCAVILGGAAAITGLVGYGAYSLGKDRGPHVPQHFSYNPVNPGGVDRLEEYLQFPKSDPPTPEEVKKYLINNYYLGRIGLEAFADVELKTDSTDEVKKTINNERIKLAFLGADILAKEEPDKNIVTDRKNGEITFEGRYFDVKNPRHLFILDDLVEQNLHLIDPDKTPEEKYKASKWIEDLNWLADSQVPVQFEANNIGYPASGSIRVLARFYRKLDELGVKNFPKKIVYKPYLMDPDFGYAGGIYRDETQEIDISENSGQDAVPHEEAHHQQARNTDFSQAIFDQIVAQAKTKTTITYDEKDTYITPDVMKGGLGSVVNFEDYAETIRMYFWDGVAFRRRIQELNYKKSDAAIVLQVKYDFAKKFFGGEEITKEGEVLDPKIGDVFVISDSDPTRLPIPLRLEPKETTALTDLVGDTNLVKILEGPVVTTYRGEEVKMWKVDIGSIKQGIGFEEKPDTAQGWISEGWFGDKVLAKEADEFKSK